jgi:uncharacterized membrane protein YdjX (TVP38/TMEM64 family)
MQLRRMPEPTHTPRRRRPARLLAFAGALLVVLVLMLLWSQWDAEAFAAWKQQAGPLPYFAAMVVLPALGLPMTPLFIVAGATFGAVVGLTGSLLALAGHLALCFWVARSGLRPHVERWLAHFDVDLPAFDGRRDRALRFLLLVRLAPGVPAFAKNYLLGVAGIPFALYMGVSMLVGGTYAAGFVILGESVLARDARGVAIAAAGLALAGLAFWWLRRQRHGDG